ncbi:DLW-39 family protein [Nocardioides insulae]|nr:DLW-39 family protein [Nocardioides insulae]
MKKLLVIAVVALVGALVSKKLLDRSKAEQAQWAAATDPIEGA